VPPVALRPRSTTEIIDASVSLLRQHYVELVTATALFTVPWLILGMIGRPPIGMPVTSNFQTAPLMMPLSPQALPGMIIPRLIVAMLLGALASATTVVIVSDNYLGREVTIAGAILRALNRIVAVAITGVLQGIAIVVGFMLFIIPGFFCIAWFFSAVNIVMVEGKGPVEALSRGKFLAKGSVGRILGTLFLCGLLVWVVNLVLGLIVGGIFSAVHITGQPVFVAAGVVSIFIYPLLTVATTVLYFDLRIRKEGMDLEVMAKELGVALPNPVTA
jgi:hypothetical protein